MVDSTRVHTGVNTLFGALADQKGRTMREHSQADSAQHTLSFAENQAAAIKFVSGPSGTQAIRAARLIEASSDRARQLAECAPYLSLSDAALMRSVFADGKSVKQVSELLGKAPRSLQRRVARLSRRCLSPEFAFVALNVGRFETRLARVATLCVLHGRSVRSVAEELELSQHLVRTLRASVLAMARGAMQGSRHDQGAGTPMRSWRPNTKDDRASPRQDPGKWRSPTNSD